MSAVAVTGYLFVEWSFKPTEPQNKAEIVFEVPPGQSFSAVLAQLKSEKLIRYPEIVSYYARIKSWDKKIKRGEYTLNRSLSTEEIFKVLMSGVSRSRKISIPEGKNIFDIAEIFENAGLWRAQEFLSFVRDPINVQKILGMPSPSLEGYLFPETYLYTKFTKPEELIEQMVKMHLKVMSELRASNQLPGWSHQQVVTLASIVEKETGAPFERPTISSVFHNRLNKKMRLETDPTILYGMADLLGEMPKNIRREDIRRPTRYNTYVIYGLPPGPIANPGRAALEAALQPDGTPYLFFVSKNDGTHIFSEKYSDHNKAVNDFQRNSRAREGKSWRDLNK